MKKIVFLVFLLSFSYIVKAQNGVNIYQDPRIEFYMNKYDGAYQVQKSQFIYRIKLIGTYNRDEANSTIARFRKLYPGESSLLNHNGIQYIVTAGSFDSKPEAEVMLQQLRRNFPASFILPPEKQN